MERESRGKLMRQKPNLLLESSSETAYDREYVTIAMLRGRRVSSTASVKNTTLRKQSKQRK